MHLQGDMTKRRLFPFVFMVFAMQQKVKSISFHAEGGVTHNNNFHCGETVKFVCQSDPNPIDVGLSYGDVQVLSCSFGSCSKHINFTNNISTSLQDGYFNLTINRISNADNQRRASCQIYSDVQTIAINVIENPQYVEINDEQTENETIIDASTACVFPSHNLTFLWFTVNASNTSDVQSLTSQNLVTNITSFCSPLSDCNGAKLSNSFRFASNGSSTRGPVYLEVVVIYGYKPETLEMRNRTKGTFVIPDLVTTTEISTKQTTIATTTTESQGNILSEGKIAGIVVGVLISLALIITGVVLLIRHKRSRVDDILETPYEFKIKNVKETSASFTCVSGNSTSKQTITLCCVPVNVESNARDLTTDVLSVFSGEKLTLTIEGLRQNCQYKCFVFAVNLNGKKSEISSEIIIRTKVPLPPVTNVKKDEHQKSLLGNFKQIEDRSLLTENSVEDEHSKPWLANFREDKKRRTATSVTLTWSDITESNGICFIHFRRTRNVKEKWETLMVENHSECTLKNLKPGSSYTIKLSSQNHNGLLLETEPIRIKTKAAIPVAPINFKCKSVTEENVTLTWVPGNELPNQRFGLSFSTSEEEEAYRPILVSYSGEERLVYTVGELMPGTTYMFEIVSLIGKRTSDTSKVIQVTTKGIPIEEEQHADTRTSKFSINNLH